MITSLTYLFGLFQNSDKKEAKPVRHKVLGALSFAMNVLSGSWFLLAFPFLSCWCLRATVHPGV